GRCRAELGEPFYDPTQMVRRYYMGPVARGRETFVLAFDEFECHLPELPDADLNERNEADAQEGFRLREVAKLFCEDEGCRMSVFLPLGRNRWAKAFDDTVITWNPEQRDGKVDGPNVRLRIVTMGPQCGKEAPLTCNRVFRAAGSKLVAER